MKTRGNVLSLHYLGFAELRSPLVAPAAVTVQISLGIKTTPWPDRSVPASHLSPTIGSGGLKPIGSAQVTYLDNSSPSHGQVGS